MIGPKLERHVLEHNHHGIEPNLNRPRLRHQGYGPQCKDQGWGFGLIDPYPSIEDPGPMDIGLGTRDLVPSAEDQGWGFGSMGLGLSIGIVVGLGWT